MYYFVNNSVALLKEDIFIRIKNPLVEVKETSDLLGVTSGVKLY